MPFKQLFIIILFFSTCCVYAQQPYYNQRPEYLKANSVWVFGENAGLDFNNGLQPINTAINHGNSASIADPVTGSLLFYTDGDKVWNTKHEIMPNGLLKDSFEGNTVVTIASTLDNPNMYYLFTLNYIGELDAKGELVFPATNGTLLSYSLVDMRLNNGLGDVVIEKKNIKLSDEPYGYSMLAIPGDCEDVWLMVYSFSNPSISTFHISKNGINLVPIKSTLPKAYPFANLYVSPDREKIVSLTARDANSISFGRFDLKKGEVSDLIRVPGKEISQVVSLCFSPDNSKYYVSSIDRSAGGIYQYDLSNYNASAITASEKLIKANIGRDNFMMMKLYNDTIYVLNSTNSNPRSSIHKINQPNLSGTACDFQEDAIQLLNETFVRQTFNSEVVLPLPLDTLHNLALDTMICAFDLTLDAPLGFDSYKWNDESTAINKTVSEPGKYWVLSISDCGYRVDTFIVTHEALEIPEINADGHQLFTTATFFSYQWIKDGAIIPNATGSKYNALEEGDYQVIVSNAIGCTDTSKIFKVEKETHIPGSADLAKQIRIYPNPATDFIRIDNPASVRLRINLSGMEGRAIITANDPEYISLKNLVKGIYLLEIMDQDGNLIKIEKILKY